MTRPRRARGFPHDGLVLKRIDHVGVIVDDLAQARSFLADMGMRFDRDLVIPGRLRAAFYACGETQIEVIQIDEPEERARRLGDDTARVEHIAFEVDSLSTTLQALQGLGVKTTTSEPMAVGANLNYWTTAESCDGVQYQLIEKGAAATPS
jgi:methylmalonyl-CoA/ethylmalonyl-CoA epimerase